MNDLGDLVFNPKTGLFENRKDPTAHLTAQELRAERARKSKADPKRAMIKPHINFFRRSGDERPTAGEKIYLAWNVEQARSVSITFPDKQTLRFPPVGNCLFTLPNEECRVRLIAVNGEYRTQQTMRIKSKENILKLFIHRISSIYKRLAK